MSLHALTKYFPHIKMPKAPLSLAWVALPVRRRYFFTRHGGLRARYLALPLFAALAISGWTGAQTLRQFSSTTEHALVFSRDDTAARSEPALIERLASSQERMQRYVRPPEEKPAPQPKEKIVEIGKGDTLAGVLQEAGLSGGEAYHAVKAMEEYYDPRRIRPGQKIALRFDPVGDSGYDFSQLKMDIDALKTVRLQRDSEDTITAQVDEKKTVRRSYAQQANIELSLYGSALKAGMPAAVIGEAIRVFSWDVDFQRDIRHGDVLEVMYDQLETEDGTPVMGGDILYARLNVNGHDIPLYRYETADGDVDYFTPDGQSIRKALMSTPVDGARLSSGFGARKHPVLGYTKMHKGTDFAAPTGTPIYAAGDGTIEQIGKWSSYGNYVRIRHNATLKTAYAHMSKFGKGLSAGSRVKQGQVIGYIGTTGRSTGPHLHYEVLVNGTQVNPRTVKTPQGETLKGKELAAFKDHVAQVSRQYAALSGGVKLASLR